MGRRNSLRRQVTRALAGRDGNVYQHGVPQYDRRVWIAVTPHPKANRDQRRKRFRHLPKHLRPRGFNLPYRKPTKDTDG